MKNLSAIAKSALLLAGVVMMLAGCTAAGTKQGYNKDDDLHERLSRAIQKNGFSHGVRGVRDDQRVIDSVIVHVPLDSLKRQFINLHNMLFDVSRLCARPEYRHLDITIELNAADAKDREYLSGIVGPIVADTPNVTMEVHNEDVNDLVITTVFDPNKPHRSGSKPGAK
jgi:hypothetical protein